MSVIECIDEELGVLEKVKSGMAAAHWRFEERRRIGGAEALRPEAFAMSIDTLVSPAHSVRKVYSPAAAHAAADDSVERMRLLEASIQHDASRHRELEMLGLKALQASDATSRTESHSLESAGATNESAHSRRPYLGM